MLLAITVKKISLLKFIIGVFLGFSLIVSMIYILLQDFFLGLIILLGLISICFSYFLLERKGYRLHLPFIMYFTKNFHEEIIKSPTLIISQEIANKRAEAIRNIINNQYAIRKEFLEIPPDYKEFLDNSFEMSKLAYASQKARLKWQLKEDYLLLAERVNDALITINRKYSSNKETNEECLVKIVKIEEESNDEINILPWKVIIETTNPSYYRDKLIEIENKTSPSWFGIRVDLVKSTGKTKFLGKCKLSGRKEGLLGGVFASNDNQQQYGVTCAHVISQKCASAINPTNTPQDTPIDIALLGVQGYPCLNNEYKCFNYSNHLSQCDVASENEIKSFMHNHSIYKQHPKANQVEGVIRHYLTSTRVNGKDYRFPCVEVVTRVRNYTNYIPPVIANLLQRLLTRDFAVEGDSGCWVFESSSQLWIGMIFGGYVNYSPATYVALAEPIMEYVKIAYENEIQTPFYPFKFLNS